MHSTTFFRTAMTVVVLLCCALVAFQQNRVRKRPHMVTELVSVTYVPARPAAAASAPASAPAANPVVEHASAVPTPEQPVTRHAKNVRSGRNTLVASTRTPGRLTVAGAARKPTQVASKKQDRREIARNVGTTVATAPPPVPSFLLPVRRLGFSLQRRLVHAGLLKVCSGSEPRPGSDCVRPAPDG
jgi:hypothetical protein